MDKESRKHQILKCACSLFASQGYEATSLAQIAKECSCSPSLVIRHFGSKDNIYQVLLEEFKSACEQPILVSVPDGNTIDKLEALYNALIIEIRSATYIHADLYAALQSRRGSNEQLAQVMRSIQDVGAEIFLPILREGVKEGIFPSNYPCEKVSQLLWLFINGTHRVHIRFQSSPVLPFSVVKEYLLEI